MEDLETLAAAYVAAWKLRQESCSKETRAAWKAQPKNRSAVDWQARERACCASHLFSRLPVFHTRYAREMSTAHACPPCTANKAPDRSTARIVAVYPG